MFIKSQESKSMFVCVSQLHYTHTHTHTHTLTHSLTHTSIQTHPHVPEHYALALTDFTIAEGTCLRSPPQYSGSKFFSSQFYSLSWGLY